MPTAEPRPTCATRLHRYVLAASAAASLTACPAAQVRPDAGRCPSGALEAMRQLRLEVGDAFFVITDINHPDGVEALDGNVAVNDGPITSRLDERHEGLPEGTLLYGQVWTGGKQIYGRYTRARTPAGRDYPICIVLGDENGYEKWVQSGYTTLPRSSGVTVVDRFP